MEDMEPRLDPVGEIRNLMDEEDRSYAWLSRATGIGYKELLRQVKHGDRPLSLRNAFLIADALGVNVSDLVEA